VLDDLPAKTEKTKTSAGGLSPPMSKYKPEDRSLSKPAPQGDTSGQASQNLLLNLYSLVKEPPDFSGPAERGRDSRPRKTDDGLAQIRRFQSRSPLAPVT
jgi:hypothetical protein